MKNILLADTSSLTSSRGLGQRIAYGVALGSYLCAVLCLVAVFIWLGELGSEHPVIASLGASLVFFVGVGIVLHVIGRANLPSLGFSQEKSRI
ncbi:MAG: hypothetical protein KAX46_13335 [Chromatiaceae bacterium]|jgi:predicted tellurium resistance membrane protein TerC|nr:hypothetical protein [Chromatiaceae bacterium]